MSEVVKALWAYLPKAKDDLERGHVLKTIDFIARTPKAFERDHDALGHVGATAVVVSPDYQKLLMARHTVLKTWSFFGNHSDGSMDLPRVARGRVEKDGNAVIEAALRQEDGIFDVDVHYVPAHERKGEIVPEHLHYDIAYLFTLDMPEAETESAGWFDVNAFETLEDGSIQKDTQARRIFEKIAELGDGRS